MNPEQLWETTMDPETRKLMKISITDLIAADLQLDTLMGEDSTARKKWIDENVNFEYDE